MTIAFLAEKEWPCFTTRGEKLRQKTTEICSLRKVLMRHEHEGENLKPHHEPRIKDKLSQGHLITFGN